mmetsp:Transcript_139393/g.242390  ORF Transcript_139393/g.242390 Transcript_139393/m.242390 type:complete len:237 (+) Transcript_139393:710-1420(+)
MRISLRNISTSSSGPELRCSGTKIDPFLECKGFSLRTITLQILDVKLKIHHTDSALLDGPGSGGPGSAKLGSTRSTYEAHLREHDVRSQGAQSALHPTRANAPARPLNVASPAANLPQAQCWPNPQRSLPWYITLCESLAFPQSVRAHSHMGVLRTVVPKPSHCLAVMILTIHLDWNVLLHSAEVQEMAWTMQLMVERLRVGQGELVFHVLRVGTRLEVVVPGVLIRGHEETHEPV